MIRIVLADDEDLLRSALAQLLPFEAHIEVVAEASNGDEALEAVIAHQPDVLVLDLEMPTMDGLEVLDAIQQHCPAQRVLMLTRHAKPGVLRKALELGARGFVSKSSDPAHIAEVIGVLHCGKRWVDAGISSSAVTADCPLTEREKDVLHITGQGYTASEVAGKLFLAEGTVRNYLSTAMAKTHAKNRHEAARFAREHGWL